jgi:hypothetical protein
VKQYEASTSSGLEATVVQGGQRQFIINQLTDYEPTQFSYYPKSDGKTLESDWGGSLSPDVLAEMIERRNGIEEYRVSFHPPPMSEIRRAILNQIKENKHVTNKPLPPPDTFGVDVNLDYIQPGYDHPVLLTRVQAITEPLKVRMITKGESLFYYYSKFFQKAMWAWLRKFPQFALVGEPLSQSHLNWLRGTTTELLPKFEFWVSGDYSAATDGIKLEYTKSCFEAFLNAAELDGVTRAILRSVLYEQIIVYNDSVVMQKRGQLMGSPLSFPILCMINFLTYWRSMERYLLKSINHFEKLPVLINGDDILFGSNSVHYELWIEELKEVGFSLSIGKNYCSPKILTVNSVLFWDHGN